MDNEIAPEHLIYHQSLLDLEPKFKIGDEILFKSGLIGSGKIVGMMPGGYYAQASGCAKKWPKIDENWKDKYVYIIAFPQPQKPVSLEEYMDMHDTYKEEMVKEWYNKMPLASLIIVIEEDIQLFEL